MISNEGGSAMAVMAVMARCTTINPMVTLKSCQTKAQYRNKGNNRPNNRLPRSTMRNKSRPPPLNKCLQGPIYLMACPTRELDILRLVCLCLLRVTTTQMYTSNILLTCKIAICQTNNNTNKLVSSFLCVIYVSNVCGFF